MPTPFTHHILSQALSVSKNGGQNGAMKGGFSGTKTQLKCKSVNMFWIVIKSFP